MQNKFYAVFVRNVRSKKTKVLGIFETEVIAISVWKEYVSKNRFSKFEFFIQECNVETKTKLLDEVLLNKCYNIANCLQLSDRCFCKQKYDECFYWQDLARARACDAAILMYELL